MKILVTGYRGFIGQYLHAELCAGKHDVHGMDKKPIFDISGGNILTAHLDWYDRVYHLAAEVDARGDNLLKMVETNVLGSIRLFEKYRDKLVFASSCAVHYPTPYGLSKKAAEAYATLCGCGIVRLCNIYGYGGHSVVDIFRRASCLQIAGEGNQIRTYAPVEKAVGAFLKCKPGELLVLEGENWTINDIANVYPDKPRRHYDQEKWDILDGRQLLLD